jgi:hypothetical protein
VGGNDPDEPDRWVLTGMNDAADGARRPEVWLYTPEDFGTGTHPGPLKLLSDVRAQCPKLDVKRLPSPPGPWSVGYAQAVAQCDVVLLIQGREGTRLAGQLAIALRKPIAALPGFGGSSAAEWNRQVEFYRHLAKDDDSLVDFEAQLENYEGAAFATCARSLCSALKTNSLDLPKSRGRIVLFIAISIVLVILWLATFGWQMPTHAETRQFNLEGSRGLLQLAALLWLSTLLGSISRAARRLIDSDSYHLSLADLDRDILMGVLLAFGYLLLCLAGSGIYKQDPLEFSRSDITRIGITMSIAGFAVGAFLEEAIDFLSERVLKKFRS